MAYNPYYPTGIYQTPIQNPYQQPAYQPNTTSLMTVFVNSENEVNDYPVAAGTTVQLISFKLGKFWLKSTGTNGVPQPLRSFSFTEETQAANIQNDSVSRAEFDALSGKIDKLIKELGGDQK